MLLRKTNNHKRIPADSIIGKLRIGIITVNLNPDKIKFKIQQRNFIDKSACVVYIRSWILSTQYGCESAHRRQYRYTSEARLSGQKFSSV